MAVKIKLSFSVLNAFHCKVVGPADYIYTEGKPGQNDCWPKRPIQMQTKSGLAKVGELTLNPVVLQHAQMKDVVLLLALVL